MCELKDIDKVWSLELIYDRTRAIHAYEYYFKRMRDLSVATGVAVPQCYALYHQGFVSYKRFIYSPRTEILDGIGRPIDVCLGGNYFLLSGLPYINPRRQDLIPPAPTTALCNAPGTSGQITWGPASAPDSLNAGVSGFVVMGSGNTVHPAPE